MFAIAIINGTYTKKGIKRIEDEINRFSIIPSGYLETYRKLMRTDNRAQAHHMVNELIVETEKIWKTKFNSERKVVDASELGGFYEEFKSTYNKLLLACDEKSYENAYCAGFMIDSETHSFLNTFTGPAVYPDIMKEVKRNDFELIRVNRIEHER